MFTIWFIELNANVEALAEIWDFPDVLNDTAILIFNNLATITNFNISSGIFEIIIVNDENGGRLLGEIRIVLKQLRLELAEVIVEVIVILFGHRVLVHLRNIVDILEHGKRVGINHVNRIIILRVVERERLVIVREIS